MRDPAELKSVVLRLAGKLGFCRAGIAPAGVAAHAARFRHFLERGYHGDMAWLDRDPDRRCDVRNLLPGAASVICLACSYAPDPADAPTETIARYARGRDYHAVLTGRCRQLAGELETLAPGTASRICVDTAPVLERELAASAGLGWIGRNGCLIDPHCGSYLLLAEIVTSLPLPPDDPLSGQCGSCRACVEACPTAAIRQDALVDARRCVSYLTIEHRRNIPEPLCRAIGRRVFGCDACQRVCPYNRRAPAGDEELRGPNELATATVTDMLLWTGGDWDRMTRGTSARRAKYEMFLRNAAVAAGNGADPAARAALAHLARHPAAMVADAARWALRRLRA